MHLYQLTDERIASPSASAHHRIGPGSPSSVWAVVIDPHAGALRARALANRIAASAGIGIVFVREQAGCLFFVTRARPGDADRHLAEQIRAMAGRFELRIVAIGAALVENTDYDLAPAAERAERAAGILAALPELAEVGWHDDLGPWIMLSRIAPGSVRIRDISPAAEVLLDPSNAIYRETVEVYLDVAGRIGDACARLHIHRTTLYYRLDKAPDSVRDALHDGSARSSLHMALKLDRLWNSRRDASVEFAL